jgi:hypothetical protein
MTKNQVSLLKSLIEADQRWRDFLQLNREMRKVEVGNKNVSPHNIRTAESLVAAGLAKWDPGADKNQTSVSLQEFFAV